MLIVVLIVLCVASLAAAVLQTMRLRTLQQKMDALRAGALWDSGFHTFQVFADGGTALVFEIPHFPHPLVK